MEVSSKFHDPQARMRRCNYKHSLFTTACLILFSEWSLRVLFTSWRISDEVMSCSSRAGSRKRTFSAEEAAELVIEDVFDDKDDDEDFVDFLTVAEVTGEKDSGNDNDQPAASAASQRVHDSSSSDDYSQGDCNLASSSRSPRSNWLRTKQRLVNSIDDALDPDNHDMMELLTPKKPRTWTAKLGPAKKKDVETIG